MTLVKVFKYVVAVDDQVHEIPGKIVHVACEDPRELLVWSEVVAHQHGPVAVVCVFATGQPIPPGAVHIGTVWRAGLVWHLYDVTEADVS